MTETATEIKEEKLSFIMDDEELSSGRAMAL